MANLVYRSMGITRFKIAFLRKYGFDSHRRYSLENQRVKEVLRGFKGFPWLPLIALEMHRNAG
jgi:hypothetical protein